MYYSNIPGWFTFSNLYDIVVNEADAEKPSILVEVGCWLGRSVVYLGEKAKISGKQITIYAVDTWSGSDEVEHQKTIDELGGPDKLYEKFLENVKAANLTNISPVRKNSLVAAQDFDDISVDMVFIDASHKYEDVLADIKAWLPKVKVGGRIMGHDIAWPDVNKAVHEVFGQNFRIESDSWIYIK